MSTITKADIRYQLERSGKFDFLEANQVVDLFFQIQADTLANHNKVKLPSIGTFSIVEKKARLGRNPKTGEDAAIPKHFTIIFRSGPKLRKKLIEKSAYIIEKITDG